MGNSVRYGLWHVWENRDRKWFAEDLWSRFMESTLRKSFLLWMTSFCMSHICSLIFFMALWIAWSFTWDWKFPWPQVTSGRNPKLLTASIDIQNTQSHILFFPEKCVPTPSVYQPIYSTFRFVRTTCSKTNAHPLELMCLLVYFHCPW